MTGSCKVAQLSMKQAARRPRPPLPKPASISALINSSISMPRSYMAWVTVSVTPRLSMALLNVRPIRYSIDK